MDATSPHCLVDGKVASKDAGPLASRRECVARSEWVLFSLPRRGGVADTTQIPQSLPKSF